MISTGTLFSKINTNKLVYRGYRIWTETILKGGIWKIQWKKANTLLNFSLSLECVESIKSKVIIELIMLWHDKGFHKSNYKGVDT